MKPYSSKYDNPYLKEYAELHGGNLYTDNDYWNGSIDTLREMSYFSDLIKKADEGKDIRDRHAIINEYAFPLLDDDAIDKIASYSPILDLGAGSGYNAYLLTQAGADVLAIDNFDWHNHHKPWEKMWFDITKGDVKDVAKYPDKTLFMSWPNYLETMAYDALKVFKGKIIIYIGESKNGCTANHDFFDEIEDESKYEEVEMIDIPVWYGIHDHIRIYRRKND